MMSFFAPSCTGTHRWSQRPCREGNHPSSDWSPAFFQGDAVSKPGISKLRPYPWLLIVVSPRPGLQPPGPSEDPQSAVVHGKCSTAVCRTWIH